VHLILTIECTHSSIFGESCEEALEINRTINYTTQVSHEMQSIQVAHRQESTANECLSIKNCSTTSIVNVLPLKLQISQCPAALQIFHMVVVKIDLTDVFCSFGGSYLVRALRNSISHLMVASGVAFRIRAHRLPKVHLSD
jgi:hypothetical protein